MSAIGQRLESIGRAFGLLDVGARWRRATRFRCLSEVLTHASDEAPGAVGVAHFGDEILKRARNWRAAAGRDFARQNSRYRSWYQRTSVSGRTIASNSRQAIRGVDARLDDGLRPADTIVCGAQGLRCSVLMVGTGSRARHPLLALAVGVGIALTADPTLAHHSRAMFDMGKNITLRGVVEEYRWQNPHSHIVVRVGAGAADRSTVGTWTVEASAISVMTSSGWTPTTYGFGDPITVVAHPNNTGSKLVLLFYATKPDGTRIYRAAHRYDGEKE